MAGEKKHRSAESQYEGLDFSFATVCQELRQLFDLAKEFLTPGSEQRWQAWVNELETFQRSKRTTTWDWQTAGAIETVAAKEYEGKNRKCAFEVHGTMSSIWTLALADKKAPRTFRL